MLCCDVVVGLGLDLVLVWFGVWCGFDFGVVVDVCLWLCLVVLVYRVCVCMSVGVSGWWLTCSCGGGALFCSLVLC